MALSPKQHLTPSELQSANTFVSLCNAIDVSPKALNRAVSDRSYHTFSIPKPKGGKRKIENPNTNLSKVQKSIARAMNNAYKPFLPDCAQGYIPKAISTSSRDIISNASMHLGKDYMYNVDLKDFFHSVSTKMLKKALLHILPEMDEDILRTIVKITTYAQRLPMGAPSSPVLSNIAALQMDILLDEYSSNNNLCYTRYVDDLTFSSNNPITNDLMESIGELVVKAGFKINPKKVRYYSLSDTKKITGIVVENNTLDITEELYNELIENIGRLRSLRKTYQHIRMLGHENTATYKRQYKQYRASIKGQLAFAERIMDSTDPKLAHLQELLYASMSENNYVTQKLYI